TEGQHLYKEFFDKQMNMLNNMRDGASAAGQNENNPQDFFRNWINQQTKYAKQMADFTQSLQSSLGTFGKPAQDYASGFSQANSAFTSMYNAWLNALNTSYDNLSRQMNGAFTKDVFGN